MVHGSQLMIITLTVVCNHDAILPDVPLHVVIASAHNYVPTEVSQHACCPAPDPLVQTTTRTRASSHGTLSCVIS